jgi:hypothetical protein
LTSTTSFWSAMFTAPATLMVSPAKASNTNVHLCPDQAHGRDARATVASCGGWHGRPAHVRENLNSANIPAAYHHSRAAANLEHRFLFIMVRRSHRQTGIGFYRRQLRKQRKLLLIPIASRIQTFQQKITKRTTRVTYAGIGPSLSSFPFVKCPKGSALWYASVLSVSSCEILIELLKNSPDLQLFENTIA